MNPKRFVPFTFAFLVLATTATLLAGSKSWLHVRVDSEDSEKVSVNVPMSLVSTVLPLLEEEVLPQEGVRFDDRDLTISELREVWEAVKAEESGEIVSVESEDSRIRVFTDGDYLLVESDEDSRSELRVRIPVPVVDALLSGEGEVLNVVAALEALQDLGVTELGVVEADEASIRIWIDEMSSSR